MRHIITSIVLSTVVFASTAAAVTTERHTSKTTCKSQHCKRVSARACNRHPACKYRVHRKEMLRKIRPYRAWLGTTGACESGTHSTNLHVGLRAYNPAGPFYGRYQFTAQTWWATGARVGPMVADYLEQAFRAVVWRERIGNPHQPAGWPVCG